MKKLIPLFLIIVFFAFAAGAETIKYVGKVGQYDVRVTLNIGKSTSLAGDHNVSGSYTYVKAGNTLKLKGRATDRSGGMELNEYTPKGHKSAVWELGYDDYDTLDGTMTLTKDGKVFKVHLTRVKR